MRSLCWHEADHSKEPVTSIRTTAAHGGVVSATSASGRQIRAHRYLTVVADHDRDGAVTWGAEGKNAATLEAFYDELGEAGCARLGAVSLDLGAAFKKATDTRASQARQCVNPCHLVALADETINKARRWTWNIA